MRWGLGPVFIYECLTGSRRWTNYAARAVGVALLLTAMVTIAATFNPRTLDVWREYARLGESYFYAIVGVELALVLLAAPAATAGAICVNRARGMLTHMLATDLSDPEIVLGKMAARLLPVLGLVACSWPVLAMASLLGGIDPEALNWAFAIILAVALLGCSMAIALSVWARKPHEVVLAVSVFWMIVMLIWPIWYALMNAGITGPPETWSLAANPFYLAFAPYYAPGKFGIGDYIGFFAATLGASATLTALAVARMRPVARRGVAERPREPGLGPIGWIRRRLPGPSLDGNPVFWREWHRSRPSRWMMVLIVLVGGGTSLACLIGTAIALASGLDVRPGAVPVGLLLALFGLILQLIFGLLILSTTAPMSMSEERQRGSLDLLAATTLSTRTIVLGKWLGALRPVVLLAIIPTAVALSLAVAHKAPTVVPTGVNPRFFERISRAEISYASGLLVATVLIHGALIASFGLAMAVWVARQGRAIALTVGGVVIVAAGWPLLVGITSGPATRGLVYISPIAAVPNLASLLIERLRYSRPDLWWITFWDVECLAMAMGLLWLTVRTFDDCLGRIPERPRRVPLLTDVTVILSALIGIGGLSGAIACWVAGPWKLRQEMDLAIAVGIILVAVGFHLASAMAASTMSGAAAPDGRKVFASRWIAAGRLVPLLAIGPALLAIGLATGPPPIRVVTKVTPMAGGGSVKIETNPFGYTYMITTDTAGRQTHMEATDAEIAAAKKQPQSRDLVGSLGIAAGAVFTVLANGAAFVAMGAALGVWIRGRRRAIAASVLLVFLATVGWPIGYIAFFDHPQGPWGWALASVIPAYSSLAFRINRPQSIDDMLSWALYWDLVWILAAVIASGLAIRTLDRRSRAATEPALVPVREMVGIGDHR